MDPTSSNVDQELLYEFIDQRLEYGIRSSINYSTQFAASLTLLVVVILVTRPDKRLSAFFILNTSALGVNVIRMLLSILYFTGPAYRAAIVIGGDIDLIPQRVFNISIAANVFDFLLAMLVEASLILQVHAVCGSLTGRYKRTVIAVSAIVAFVMVSLHFAVMIISCIGLGNREAIDYHKLLFASTCFTAGSICWFSAIFTTKLGHALLQRRRLGLKQFGPMQIIFIVSSQTMIIPGTLP